MTYVLDCSALVETLRTERGQAAYELARGELLCAPQVILPELLNAARGLLLGGHLTQGEAERLLMRFRRLPIRLFPMQGLMSTTWSLRHNLSAYDAMYIALGRTLGAPVLTYDAPLHRAAPEDTVLLS